jgi:hypothetical protein
MRIVKNLEDFTKEYNEGENIIKAFGVNIPAGKYLATLIIVDDSPVFGFVEITTAEKTWKIPSIKVKVTDSKGNSVDVEASVSPDVIKGITPKDHRADYGLLSETAKTKAGKDYTRCKFVQLPYEPKDLEGTDIFPKGEKS